MTKEFEPVAVLIMAFAVALVSTVGIYFMLG